MNLREQSIGAGDIHVVKGYEFNGHELNHKVRLRRDVLYVRAGVKLDRGEQLEFDVIKLLENLNK